MIFRYTLVNTITGESLQINEPDGWRDAVIKLGRDKDFRSLIELFDGAFIFYGDNGVKNGGCEFIRAIEIEHGPDAGVNINIKIDFEDGSPYETLFDGQLDLSSVEDMPNNKIKIAVIKDNFWAKFFSRKDTPVDLQAITDLDDEIISSPVDQVAIDLLSQIVTYSSEYNQLYSITYPGDGNSKLMLNWDDVVNDDIKLFSIVRGPVDNDTYAILGLFEAPYNGDFRLEIKLTVAEYISGTPEWASDTTVRLRIKKTNSDAQDIYAFPDYSTIGTSGVDSWQSFDVDVTYTMLRGEQLVIALNRASTATAYTVFGEVQLNWHTDCDAATTVPITLSGEQTIDGVATSTSRILVKNQGNQEQNGIYTTGAGAWTRVSDMDDASEFYNAAVYITAGDSQSDTAFRQTEEIDTVGFDPAIFIPTDPSDERFRVFPGYPKNNIKITASTTFKNTRANSFLIHDTAAAALKSYGLGVDNPFYSELFGSTVTTARQYDSDGCAWKYFLIKGLQLRGYELEDKPFFLSFMDWWKGANPIFNLGLGYETADGEQIIRVEKVEEFYQQTVIVNISNIRDITRKYDDKKIYNKISIGYQNWQSEDISGIDDPQTRRVYSIKFEKIGEEITVHSEFIAASLAIETTRRQTIERSKDYKFDDNTFIISVEPKDGSPDAYTPEFDENFENITDLLNPTQRYNIRLSVARNFLRWREWFNGCMQKLSSAYYRFTSGEGNYDMSSEMIIVSPDCLSDEYDGLPLSEKQDIEATEDFVHLPNYYEMKVPLEWDDYKTIRNNRKNAIGISLSDSDHVPLFIDQLDYSPSKGEATIQGWTTEFLDTSLIVDTVASRDCYPPASDPEACVDALTDELGEYLTTLSGACITA